MTQNYNPSDFPFREECLALIEIASNIHKTLGSGLNECIYKTEFETELKAKDIEYQTEKRYSVNINGMVLEHKFYSDFVVNDNIIVEIKSVPFNIGNSELILFNQLIMSKPKVGLVINFYNELIQFKKFVLY
ncbi:GxxExxY protein [Pedobacter mendelii]|uniref:GxxExxY protein n=1 Tax=Pedobacter mendelii TaxID=1908240 RepID=A0ABQ2BBI4_9SPHI|nr:GxxExxY protein [Pedobacter mendelii]GGI22269.1 hypothetical protein GCM10008119_01800 [Pedobacter mendelii]